ncbi:MAG: ATP synthase subunit I [Candidatus Celaenobacter antarcticus]|nr:ATP synthase subunit I [Candidatus Celaenobacter antarcticus]
MKILTNSFRKYVYHILGLIFLTEIPALLLITQNLKLWLGYSLGSILSSLNFYFQAKGAESRVGLSPKGAKLSVFRNFYIRYLVLVVFVVVFVKFLEVNVFSLLTGLLIAPATVLIDGIITGKNNQDSE